MGADEIVGPADNEASAPPRPPPHDADGHGKHPWRSTCALDAPFTACLLAFTHPNRTGQL